VRELRSVSGTCQEFGSQTSFCPLQSHRRAQTARACLRSSSVPEESEDKDLRFRPRRAEGRSPSTLLYIPPLPKGDTGGLVHGQRGIGLRPPYAWIPAFAGMPQDDAAGCCRVFEGVPRFTSLSSSKIGGQGVDTPHAEDTQVERWTTV
jgi:hypothetical protein